VVTQWTWTASPGPWIVVLVALRQLSLPYGNCAFLRRDRRYPYDPRSARVSQAKSSSLSSLVRNVPFLTSIEVSPFSWPDALGCFWFFLPSPTRRRWESGKPALGFPLFHRLVAGAVGMWESRRFCEISKEWWEEGKSWFRISTLSTTPPFPQLFCSSHGPSACPHVDSPFAMGDWPTAAPAPPSIIGGVVPSDPAIMALSPAASNRCSRGSPRSP